MNQFKHQVKGVFFDLDGTLVDTAPDMALALNLQLEAHNKNALSYDIIRPWVSHGAAALIKLGFNITPEDSEFDDYRKEYLNIYSNNLAIKSALFPHLNKMLDYFDVNNIKWGIVTNKPEFLATPLLKSLGLYDRAVSVVCGDTVTPNKPNPKPLFLACKLANLMPAECIYVGDAKRDIQAANAAGQFSIAVKYGYLTEEDFIDEWRADKIINSSEELLRYFT